MKHQIVLGHLFGDEGKGTVVQWLCSEALARKKRPVVRVESGGSQNGHTVSLNGYRHMFSSFGCGTLLGVPTVLGPNYMVDPISLMLEREDLKAHGVVPTYDISSSARIITPYDVFANRSDSKNLADGTCGKGIYMTFKRNLEIPFTWGDYLDSGSKELEEFISRVFEYYSVNYGLAREPEAEEAFVGALEYVRSTVFPVDLDDFDIMIHEGSQGLLLDMDLGIDFPHVTPSRTGLNNLPEEVLKNADVYLATRTYLTRHGEGWVPDSFGLEDSLRDPEESNIFNQYQKDFKVGILESALYESAWNNHRMSEYASRFGIRFHLCVSHADQARERLFWKDPAGTVWSEPSGDAGLLCEAFRKILPWKPDTIWVSSSPDGKYVLGDRRTLRSKTWAQSARDFREKSPEDKILWCSGCGCEGGCNLCEKPLPPDQILDDETINRIWTERLQGLQP